MAENYQLMLDKKLSGIAASGKTPTLLIHSCCAPCSSYCLEYLSEYFKITVLYFNPNIEQEEYEHRLYEQKRFVNEFKAKNEITVIDGRYKPDEFYSAVRGFENEPEGGKRCEICFRLRLGEAAKCAADGGYDYFATTLTLSPLKNAELINKIGEEMSEKYKVPYLYSDFKKKGGYMRSIELSREYSLYRQNFCGCVYSKK